MLKIGDRVRSLNKAVKGVVFLIVKPNAFIYLTNKPNSICIYKTNSLEKLK